MYSMVEKPNEIQSPLVFVSRMDAFCISVSRLMEPFHQMSDNYARLTKKWADICQHIQNVMRAISEKLKINADLYATAFAIAFQQSSYASKGIGVSKQSNHESIPIPPVIEKQEHSVIRQNNPEDNRPVAECKTHGYSDVNITKNKLKKDMWIYDCLFSIINEWVLLAIQFTTSELIGVLFCVTLVTFIHYFIKRTPRLHIIWNSPIRKAIYRLKGWIWQRL